MYDSMSGESVNHGLAPLLPLRVLFGPDSCRSMFLEYFPYLDGANQCSTFFDAPARVPLAMWHYLSGREWLILGDYERALECFAAVPPDHPWASLAAECAGTAKRLSEDRADVGRASAPERSNPVDRP